MNSKKLNSNYILTDSGVALIVVVVIFIFLIIIGLYISNSLSITSSSLGISNDNIGDYIDLGNDPLKKGNTSENWRILYVDGEIVYAILADYLPNSTGYAKEAGLNTGNFIYTVWSDIDRNTLINGLTTSNYWKELANGHSNDVIGSPTIELLINSYNTKYGTSLEYSDYQTLDTSDSLYIPHTEEIEDCYGYLLASEFTDSDNLWIISAHGVIGVFDYNSTYYGIRPVVSLSVDALTENLDNNKVWKIK